MTAYVRPYDRSFAGVLSDRYADGLESILVVGDVTLDIDTFYEEVKERDGYPVLRELKEETRYGCAQAIVEMIREMNVPANVATDPKFHSVKYRIIVGDKVLCRLDDDHRASPPRDLPPAALFLVADYAKGAVDSSTCQRLSKLYPGKEIIADWHPSRPREFYEGATALKASWLTPLNVGLPLIRTEGRDGMTLFENGKRVHKRVHFPGVTPIVDACGAGDMVLATLGAGRLKGLSWVECCEWASENAALVCQQWGSVAVGKPREALV